MSHQKKFLFVINPISGGTDKTALIETTKKYAEKEGVELIPVETTGDNDEKNIKHFYDKYKPERILVAGGDGTIKLVAEALENDDVVLGILPAGSANGLSVDLGLPDGIEENLEIAFYGNYIEMDMVSINGKRSLHLSDIGINAELIKKYEEGSIRGKLGYALQAINTLSSLQDIFRVKVKANGHIIETEARMVVIANTQKYGTGVTINPIGIMDDGKFEVVILKNLDISIISKILAGNIIITTGEDVDIISAEEAEVITDVPVCFQIDGEYYGEVNKLEAKILHKQLKIAVPNP